MLFQYNNEPYYKPERSYMSKTISKYLESHRGHDKKRGHSYNVSRAVGIADVKGKEKKKKVYCCNNKAQNGNVQELFYINENERLQKEIAEYQRKMNKLDKQIRMLEEWKRGLIKHKVYAYEYESEQSEFIINKHSDHNHNNSNSNIHNNSNNIQNEHLNTIQTLSMTFTNENND